jgi:hypothetical protein
VFIRTEQDSLQNKAGKHFAIVPGMIATVDIRTGEDHPRLPDQAAEPGQGGPARTVVHALSLCCGATERRQQHTRTIPPTLKPNPNRPITGYSCSPPKVTMATQNARADSLSLLLFTLRSGKLMAINLLKVSEIIPCPSLTKLPESHPHVKGVATLRGHSLSVIDVRHR